MMDDGDHGGGILKAVKQYFFLIDNPSDSPEKVDVSRDLSAFASDGTTWLWKDDGSPLLGEVWVYVSKND